MQKTVLRKIGNSTGITLPKPIIEKYYLKEGTLLHIVEKEDGFFLTPFDPEFEDWILAFERTNIKYKNALKTLAKK